MGIGRGNHPNSRKNLKIIKAGEVRNPKGFSAKGRQRIEMRDKLNELRAKYKLGDLPPFTPEMRRKYYEFFRSLSASEFVKAASDPDIPLGAIIDAKNMKTDFSEGTSYNTDRAEKQIYGNKGSVNVSGSLGGGLGIDAIGFVFGGEEIGENE